MALVKAWPAVTVSAALKAERAFKKLNRMGKEKKLRSRSRSDAISRLLKGAVPQPMAQNRSMQKARPRNDRAMKIKDG